MLRHFLPALPLVAGALVWQDAVTIASGRGDKGPWRQNDSRYDYVDDATVAFSTGGGQLVAWAEQGNKDVWIRHVDAAGRVGKTLNVSRSPATFSWHPRIAVDPGRPGRVYLLWQEIIFSGGSHGGDILFAASNDGGRSFGAPRNLSRSEGGDGKGRLSREVWSNGSLDLAVGADGTIVAAWTEYHGALWVACSVDAGASFSAPRQVAGDGARPVRAPALAAGSGATVYLAWTVGEDPTARIRVARSNDGGARFGAPQLVESGAGRADAPGLAVDGAGRLHLVFAQHGAHARVRYTSMAPDGSFAPARTLSGPHGAYPALATDGKRSLVVVWEQLGQAGRGQSLGYASSSDGGRSFSAPAIVPGSEAPEGGANGSQQGLLGRKLAVDGAGRVAVVNSSLVVGRRSRVWLMRLLPDNP
jgi:hypothetical protein